ncbi:MAG: hypothetical protein ACRDN9_14685 [Streptosporangiaceae bacterium]
MTAAERYRMVCPECQGTGQRHVMRATTNGLGDAFTVVHPWPCTTCDDTGWLDIVARPT